MRFLVIKRNNPLALVENKLVVKMPLTYYKQALVIDHTFLS